MPTLDMQALANLVNLDFETFKALHIQEQNRAELYYNNLNLEAQDAGLLHVQNYAIFEKNIVTEGSINGLIFNSHASAVASENNINFSEGSDARLRVQYELMLADYQARVNNISNGGVGELNYEITNNIKTTAFQSVGLPPQANSLYTPLSTTGNIDSAKAQFLFQTIVDDNGFWDFLQDGALLAYGTKISGQQSLSNILRDYGAQAEWVAYSLAALANNLNTEYSSQIEQLYLKLEALNGLFTLGHAGLNSLADVLENFMPEIIGQFNPAITELSQQSAYISNTLQVTSGANDYIRIDYGNVSFNDMGDGRQALLSFNKADGGVRGILYNTDGTKTVFYPDANATNGLAQYTYTDLDELGTQALYVAQQVTLDAVIQLRAVGADLIQNHPDILNASWFQNLPQELQDTIENIFNEGHVGAAESGKIYDVSAHTSIDSADENQVLQKKSIVSNILDRFSDADLAYIATNAPDQSADLRVGAFWGLYERALANGTVSTNGAGNTLYTLPSGIYLESVNTGDPDKSVALIKYQGVSKPIGVVTSYAENFQHQVVEVLDSATNSVIVDITTTDPSLNQAFSGGTVTLKYPENFVFSEVGGYVGNILGQQLADGDIYESILYQSALKTLGEHTGTVLDFIANSTETLDSIFGGIFGSNTNTAETGVQALPDLFEGFVKNLQASVASAIGSEIVDIFGDAIDIGGVAGEVFEVGAGVVTTGFLSEGIDLIFGNLDTAIYTGLADGSLTFADFLKDQNGNFILDSQGHKISVGDHIQTQIFNAIAAYAGSQLGNAIIEPESQQAALFGSIGSGLATAIAGGAFGTAGTALQSLVTFGMAGGPIGIAIAAFAGTVAGTFLGNLFGGGESTPTSWGRIEYDPALQEYKLLNSWGSGGATDDVGESMAVQALNGINDILEASYGKLRTDSNPPYFQIGMKGKEFQVLMSGGEIKSFGTAADAINYAAFKTLKDFDLVGGHAVVMRAWHNSDAENIFEFADDIKVAEAFQVYLANPAGVLAMMMDQPQSDTAQAWATILHRAAELELHLPHEKDLDGGWNEILLAQGVDPSFIPDLVGDSITLTDPATGEETVIHHVIGPGYEIVRIEGTEGNDIINVTVDGDSITYVAAGNGDDYIEGSDQDDILVGGGGDDTIIGHDGNDWLHGGSGSDDIDGGNGEDLIVGAEHNDTLIGGEDTDTIYGNGGDDYLNPGMGLVDYLYGGDGNDTLAGNLNYVSGPETNAKLYGEAGNDHLIFWDHDSGNGGTGNDLIEFSGSSSSAYITRGQGHDTVIASTAMANNLRFDGTISPNDLYFKQDGDDLKILVLGEDQSVTVQDFFGSQNIPDLLIHALDSAAILHTRQAILNLVALHATLSEAPSGQYNYLSDTVLAGLQSSPYSIWTMAGSSQTGGAGSQTFFLSSGSPYGIGGSSNDTIKTTGTTAGHKVYAGDSGNDSLIAVGGQIDIMTGGLGDDYLDGAGGNDQLYGGYGNDTIIDQSGEDLVHGGAGNDTIFGRHGNDTHYGDDGDDYIEERYGDNIISGGKGSDLINAQYNLGNDVIDGEDGNDLIKAGDGKDTLNGGDGDDTVYGGGGDDWVSGASGQDYLYGGNGDDTLTGSAGDDFMYGGSENDKLFGDEGNDFLEGSAGNDYLAGGAGDDTYYYAGLNRFVSLNKLNNTGRIQLDNAVMGANALTISMTFKNAFEVTDDHLFHYATSSQHNTIKFYNNTSYAYMDVNGIEINTGYSGFQGADWQTMTISWDAVTGDVALYDDGQQVFTTQITPGATIASGGTLMIGQYQDSQGTTTGQYDFNGEISNFTIWDHVLNASEITNGQDHSDALHGFILKEGSGSVGENEKGNGDAALLGDYEWQNNAASNNFISLNKTNNTGRIQLDNAAMGGNAITISMTFNNSLDVTDDHLFHYATSSQHNTIKFYNNPSSAWMDINGIEINTGYSGFQGKGWQTMTLTWNATTGDVALYDGSQQVFTTQITPGATIASGGTLMIGQYQDSLGSTSGQYDFDGDISKFVVWDHTLSASEIANNPDTNDALHYFKFTDGHGSVVTNVAGNGDASLIGDYEWPQAEPQDFVSFNNNTNTGRVQLNNAEMGANAITISMAFKNNNSVVDDHLFHYATTSQHNTIKFYNNTSSTWLDIDGVQINTGYGGFQGTDWQTMTLSWNASSGAIALYDDGTLVYSGQISGGRTIASDGILMIGQYQDSYGSTVGQYAINADISRFTIWDHVLSASEIATGVNRSDALHDFEFNEGQGSTVTNLTGNGDATLTGDFEWHKNILLTDEEVVAQMGTDTLLDSAGEDTISFGNNIELSDLLLERNLEDQDDLIVKLLGSSITTVENHFSEGTIENFEFNNGATVAVDAIEVTLSGNSGNNTLTGTDQDDLLYGAGGNDILWGGKGEDSLTGGSGADTFLFKADHLDGNMDTISDFSISDEDVLDVSDLLEAYDPITDLISDFIQITNNGADSILAVDTNGGANNFVQIAKLIGVASLTDEQALEVSGNLVIV